MEWAAIWFIGVLQTLITGSYGALFIRAGKHQMTAYRTVGVESLGVSVLGDL